MADIYNLLQDIYEGMKPTLEKCGFSPLLPDGLGKDEVPLSIDSGRYFLTFAGNGKAVRIEHFNNKIAIYGALKEGEILDSDYSKLTETLFDPAEANEKDVRYVVNDFSDTVIETFGIKGAKAPVKSKLPTPVSKAAVQSGSSSYDPNTLASRFTTIFPELRAEYKANIDKYGQFLPEDFFLNHGNKVVLDTIKQNNPTAMKRMFKLFNEIYDDGTNETQSLICVTILGAMNNDQEMLANCVDYMSPELTGPVINVNKYLGSRDGKGARMKLDNPPPYKPKKKKKKNNPASRIGM
ncbi:MAG: hypothetical protein IJM02_05355 [Clostridia bacterium]|nr:hypothetical protein [Clostridia bacterium]